MRCFNCHIAILYVQMVDTQRKSTYDNSRKSAGNCHILLLLPLLISQQSSYFLVEVRVNTLGLIENFVFLFRFPLGLFRRNFTFVW